MLSRFLGDDRGQDLIEYGLLAALISVALVVGVLAVGGSINVLWNSVAARIP